MENYKELIEILDEQERELQFSEFTCDTALKIGLDIIERAETENKKIVIDITRNGHQLFHYSFEGTSSENDQWIIRKNKTVNLFNISSYKLVISLLSEGKTLEESHKISSFEYAVAGGAFPIIIKNVGVIGTITISGLPQEEDHEMVVSAIKKYLDK